MISHRAISPLLVIGWIEISVFMRQISIAFALNTPFLPKKYVVRENFS